MRRDQENVLFVSKISVWVTSLWAPSIIESVLMFITSTAFYHGSANQQPVAVIITARYAVSCS